jgi:antitoxin HicB
VPTVTVDGTEFEVQLIPDPTLGYTVIVPSMPNCVSEGDSWDEAIAMIQEAISLCLESEREWQQ